MRSVALSFPRCRFCSTCPSAATRSQTRDSFVRGYRILPSDFAKRAHRPYEWPSTTSIVPRPSRRHRPTSSRPRRISDREASSDSTGSSRVVDGMGRSVRCSYGVRRSGVCDIASLGDSSIVSQLSSPFLERFESSIRRRLASDANSRRRVHVSTSAIELDVPTDRTRWLVRRWTCRARTTEAYGVDCA